MLLSFSIENFRSIKDQQTFSFEPYGEKQTHPGNIKYPGHAAKDGLLATSVIYGPNASGKSNVLRALKALEYLVKESSNFKLDDHIPPYEPHKLDRNCRGQPVRLGITFLAPDNSIKDSSLVKFHYEISFTDSEIVSEALHFYPRRQAARIFERNKGQPIVYGEYYRGDRKNIENQLLENQLFLSKAANSNVKQLRSVYLFFSEKLKVIPSFFEPVVGDRLKQFYAARLSNDKQPGFKNKFNRLIKILDTGINEIKVEEADESKFRFPDNIPKEIQNEIKETYQYEIKTTHKYFDQGEEAGEIEFDVEEESEGTKRLFSIAGLVLDALEDGDTIVIDEFEKSLHPHIIKYLIKLFRNPKINSNNAQLLFATHDISQLDPNVFRKDQVWFTRKDSYGATSLYSIVDFKGIRKNIPFDRWYDSGKFFAVPHVNELEFELLYGEEAEEEIGQ